MPYIVAVDSPRGVAFYGGAREFWRYKGIEAILEGPAETGKTLASLTKLHLLLCKYPGSRALMLRKAYKSIIQTAVVTYEKKVLPFPPEDPRSGVEKYGGNRPEFYDYPNSSRLVVGGLDIAEKVLSAEYDFIYVNQAEELSLAEWETLVTRATGRAGNTPYTQVMGDCNPGPPTHWILHRKALRRFEQRHEHNPTLFDQKTGEVTEQGKRTLAVLDSLTGVRKKRLRHGLWASAEGQVYEDFDPAIHVADAMPPGWEQWPRYRVIDFGYTNPFVCLWAAIDPDGRIWIYREIYHTRRTVTAHSAQINALSEGEIIIQTIVDHDAEDRATLAENGIQTEAANKAIRRGIQMVEERLKVQPDGKPRLFVLRDCLVEADPVLYREYPGDLYPVCTEQEFTSYVWPSGSDGKSNKEVPIDAFNHGMDALRYLVMYFDGDEKRGEGGVWDFAW